MGVQPIVPGFTIRGELSSSGTGSTWGAVRSSDDRPFALRSVSVADVGEALDRAARDRAVLDRIRSEHMVRQHGAIALADGTLVLVLDQHTGGDLGLLLAFRGHLRTGETVTTLAPLFGALADLHDAGVVHGDLSLDKVLFSDDGRPMVSDLGVSSLSGGFTSPVDATSGLAAPELIAGAAPTPASDVYALAAIGWFCLTGGPPAHPTSSGVGAVGSVGGIGGIGGIGAVGAVGGVGAVGSVGGIGAVGSVGGVGAVGGMGSLRSIGPSHRLVEILTACLCADPAGRPPARQVAVGIFDAVLAEPVALASSADPATEITRRIRAAVVAGPTAAGPVPLWKRPGRRVRSLSAVSLLVASLLGGGVTWYLLRSTPVHHPAPVHHTATAGRLAPGPGSASSVKASSAKDSAVGAVGAGAGAGAVGVGAVGVGAVGAGAGAAGGGAAGASPVVLGEVMTSTDSPRRDGAGLLKALVDARAVAYVARDPSLLDLVYSPGAALARQDRGNIATALRNGATYLGLRFVVTDVAFVEGTAKSARIRATIVTPAYETGQRYGRRIPHPQGSVGPSIFAVTLTPQGWRILGVTAP